jgi:hypothetical protein
MAAPIRPDLIDEMLDAYMGWRRECVTVRTAYREWSTGPGPDRRLAFAAYRAALDREQQASLVYADCSRRVEHELAPKPGVLRRLWPRGGKPATRPVETAT